MEQWVSPEEQELFELAAKRSGMNVSDWVRTCCLQAVFTEIDPRAIKQAVEAGAQRVVDVLAAGRAATFRVEESRAKMVVIGAIAKRGRSDSSDR